MSENIVPTRDRFPNNSVSAKKEKTETPEPEKISPIAKGRVRKPSLAKKTQKALFSSSAGEVGSYVLWDVIIPAAKQTISDIVVGSVERSLFGESASRRSSRFGGGPSRVSYTSYSRRIDDTPPRERDRAISRRGRQSFDFSEIVLDDRAEALGVIEHLRDRIDVYGQATVADLYELCGVSTDYTDRNWGWTHLEDLRTATYRRIRDGYVLVIPDPYGLDRA